MATKKQALTAVGDEGHNPSWQEDALGFLISPVGREDFLANIYEQKELLNLRDGTPPLRRSADPRIARSVHRQRRSARGHAGPFQQA